MKRVVIVYNPRSSKAKQVREEVIVPAQKQAGLMIGKYGVLKTNVDDNARRLASVLQNGDTVVAAGGDGTATIALNGIVLSKKQVRLTVLPYGNFNDMARTLEGLEGKTWYPLEMKINGEHWRYAGAYFTVGMFAKATQVFEEKAERKKLQQKQGGVGHSIWQLAKWYFKHKQEAFLPETKLNGKKITRGVSDYLVVNSRTVAKVMKAEQYGLLSKTFWVSTGRLTNFWRLIRFMEKSMAQHLPGERAKVSRLEFAMPTKVWIQAEGESREFQNVERIEVAKVEQGIEIAQKLW